ncbi:LiaF transmembrane domain-containing protein [Brevibacillus brevis]|uniref:LiaF transmembrane domain-containing protein n=1 Tax=Brevibacillus brevis TaxID=1393 RepID=A0ABY9T6V5_BREBE|nr:hypothetical protein [Brevibacillus brevis]WNC15841.1 hypothetical protein RGB73_05780 [Brevibacillus brevis]
MSERSGKFLLGLVLLLIGGLVLLDQLGIDSGDILGLLVPGVIMLYGARKVLGHGGSRFWGVLVFLFGLLMLFGKLHLLFHSILAIGVIYLGYRLIRPAPTPKEGPPEWERQWAKSVLKEDVLDRWEKNATRNQP